MQGFLDKGSLRDARTELDGTREAQAIGDEEQVVNEYFNIAYNLTATFAMEDLNPIVHSVEITRWKGIINHEIHRIRGTIFSSSSFP